MNRMRIRTLTLAAVFCVCCAGALFSVFSGACGGGVRRAADTTGAAGSAPPHRASLSVGWRAPLPFRANRPCPFAGGWIVSDAAGGVTALSASGRRLWRTSFSNAVFDAGAVVADGFAVAASQQGTVFALRAATGETAWTTTTDGFFQQAPLTGALGGEAVVWLISQADGCLFCLRVRDGATVWRGTATNRCDGEPVVWRDLIAYGNCDGAVYLFDAASGHPAGRAAVGEDDQMAGGMWATAQGKLVVGTRQGNLAVVDARQRTLEAKVNLSPGELFVTPAEAFDGELVTGTAEGDLVFCRLSASGLQIVKRVPLGAPVDELIFAGGRLAVLAGGAVHLMTSTDGPKVRVAVGDEVYGLAAGSAGAWACVADQALVCLAEEMR